MKQSVNSTAKNILMGLSSDKRVQKLLNQFHNLTEELKKKNAEITAKIDKNTQARMSKALTVYQGAVKNFQQMEAKIESEIEKTLVKVKGSTHDFEKNLMLYKEKALRQIQNLQNADAATKSTTSKKSSRKARSAKTKSTQKASLKATSVKTKAPKAAVKRAKTTTKRTRKAVTKGSMS